MTNVPVFKPMLLSEKDFKFFYKTKKEMLISQRLQVGSLEFIYNNNGVGLFESDHDFLQDSDRVARMRRGMRINVWRMIEFINQHNEEYAYFDDKTMTFYFFSKSDMATFALNFKVLT